MKIEQISTHVSVSDQVQLDDLAALAESGVEILVCNRPDGESAQQPAFAEIQRAAEALNIQAKMIAFAALKVTDEQSVEFADLLDTGQRIHAYCRTGNRSKKLLQAAKALNASQQHEQTLSQQHEQNSQAAINANAKYEVVIIGAGSGGIAAASSLLKRNKSLRIAIIDPAQEHFYQPGWTMVGGGVFNAEITRKPTREVIPNGVEWLMSAVTEFSPDENYVNLDNGAKVYYSQLIIAPGLQLDWSAIEGLEDTLGKNGVTSNYRFDLAPYTWELVKKMQRGKAIFTQAPMPIKCAGAPQKALYLSASQWLKANRLQDIEIDFCNAGGVLFGVKEYVPALMSYIKKYRANLRYMHNLIKVDGEQQIAWFNVTDSEGNVSVVESPFDFLHVCPPQCAPAFIRDSVLSDKGGWLDVDPASLCHKQFNNIWGVGDVLNTTNAKTMAAARKQAPVVAQNVLNALSKKASTVAYDGYGSCPLTVEQGKIVLAEFTYGGQVEPSFPRWLNNGLQATRFAWFLKVKALPWVYWQGMLKGREWLAKPKKATS